MANHLLQVHCADLPDNNTFTPTDVSHIIEKLGIALRIQPLPPAHFCYVTKSNGMTTILLNNALPDSAKRYYIAHALGHYFYNSDKSVMQYTCHDPRLCCSSVEADWINAFAACLLVPTDSIRAAVGADIDEHITAKQYDVPTTLIDLRMQIYKTQHE